MSRATTLSRKIQCILFDMDGVLVDVSRSYRRAIIDTASQFLGAPIEPTAVQQYKNRGGFNDDWELTHAIISDAGVTVTIEDVVDVFQQYYRGRNFDGYIATESAIFEHDTLTSLNASATLGVVTGRPEAEALWTVSHFGWKDIFRVVLAKEGQDGKHKPDAFPLRRAMQLLEDAGYAHDPGETAYVGDTVDDMAAAVAAGMTPVGFVPPYLDQAQHGEVLRRAGAQLVFSRSRDLQRLLA